MRLNRVGTEFNRVRTGLNENADIVESEFNSLSKISGEAESKSTQSLSVAMEAKVQSQRAEDKADRVRSELDEIVNDGESDAEVAAARVPMEGNAEPSLSARLVKDFTEVNQRLEDQQVTLNELDAIENKFELSKYEPYHFSNLVPAGDTVMQWFGIEEKSEDIYLTQVYQRTSGNNEHYIISRLTSAGKLLDKMIVRNGGHGTTIGLERVGSQVYIWSNMNIVDTSDNITGYQLVRFPYTPNNAIVEVPNVQVYGKFNNRYTTPTIDSYNGLMTLRYQVGGVNKVELRSLEDVKQGRDNLLGAVDIPSDLNYMQGCTSDGSTLYWYTGDTNAVRYPSELASFNFLTGELIDRITCTFGEEADGSFIDDFREPEGIFFFTDPISHQRALLAGITVGATGKRQHKVYSYGQRGVQGKLEDMRKKAHSPTLVDGSRKPFPTWATALHQIREEGRWYLSADDTRRLTDFPEPVDTGWEFDVTSPKDGALRQILNRNAASRKPKELERRINEQHGVGDWWSRVYLGEDVIPNNVSRLSDVPAGSYYINTEESNRFMDHPFKGLAGAWFSVSMPARGNNARKEVLERNSTSNPEIYRRVVNPTTTIPNFTRISQSE